jgi:hypothetical protein
MELLHVLSVAALGFISAIALTAVAVLCMWHTAYMNIMIDEVAG